LPSDAASVGGKKPVSSSPLAHEIATLMPTSQAAVTVRALPVFVNPFSHLGAPP
jgi:hypothetical protein